MSSKERSKSPLRTLFANMEARKKTTKKMVDLSSEEDNSDDSDFAMNGGDAPTTPQNGVSKTAAAGKKGRMSVERIYQKKTQLEHILLRPDMYIGSLEPITQEMWVYENDKMNRRPVTYNPGLYKIFDEILVNAADNKQRDSNMSKIKVTIEPENNKIEIENDGKGIPIIEHKVEKVCVPTLIFGHLLTSSNYDDTEKKVTGGRNGLGAKLTNIYSKKFIVETGSKDHKKVFKQEWENNMGKAHEPKIKDKSDVKDYTRITFYPDLERFKMEKLDEDIVAIMSRRAYDLCGCVPKIAVYLNGKKLPVKDFKSYCEEFIKDEMDPKGEPLKLIYEDANPRWQVGVTLSKDGFQQVSFVNSIATTKGGRHVDYIADMVVKELAAAVAKKNKEKLNIKPFQIKNHLWVFVNCLIENPVYDSQTKESMNLEPKKFGSKCDLSDKFYKAVTKPTGPIVESVLSWVRFKAQDNLTKISGKRKTVKLKGIPKLDDANNAGTPKSLDCTLILTEGDSAKTLAVAGLSVLGRDNYGIYPLKGKVLNVREVASKQIQDNKEIKDLLDITGLNTGKKYRTIEDLKSLRYGKIMIMTDQDQDGSHIKGLLINFIHYFWPDLLKLNFVEQFITPIVKVTKGKQTYSFYSLPEYNEWKAETPDANKWTVKYYKGLGTSTSAEAKEYFSDLQRHRITFTYGGQEDDLAIELAFGKKLADNRKEWLTNSMEDRKRRRELGLPEVYLYEKDTRTVSYKDFVNKELVLFSNMDNERSIPALLDGLKPGQRKVMFTCFKRNDKKDVKVAQLTGSVAERTSYHHGEAALQQTIIGLAQNFVGSNNINLLEPKGGFGTRLAGGKDAASPRYIFTRLSPLARKLFPTADDPLLNYLNDDNLKIEPEWYVPIIPMVLVNGAEGIGTGWATKVPNFNPRDLIKNIRLMLQGREPEPMKPWWKGYTGLIEEIDYQRYQTTGRIAILDEKQIEITELPIKVWTSNYKEDLDEMRDGTDKKKPVIQDYRDYTTDATVRFVITMDDGQFREASQDFYKYFKCKSTFTTSNMVLFDSNGVIRKFENVEEILREFYNVRLDFYERRKAYIEGLLEAEASRLSNQARFILEKVNFKLKIENVKIKDLIKSLIQAGYDSDPVKVWKKKNQREGEEEDAEAESDSEMSLGGDEEDKYDFDYLIDMRMRAMTEEKVRELLKQRDQKKAELEELRKKTPEDLWIFDLQELENEMNKVEAQEKEQIEEARRKSIGKLMKKEKERGKKGGKSVTKTEEDTRPSPYAEYVEPKLDMPTIKSTGAGRGRGKAAKTDSKPTSVQASDSDSELLSTSLSDRLKTSPAKVDEISKAKSGGDAPKTNSDSLAAKIAAAKKKAASAPKEKKPRKKESPDDKKGKGKKKKNPWETDSEEEDGESYRISESEEEEEEDFDEAEYKPKETQRAQLKKAEEAAKAKNKGKEPKKAVTISSDEEESHSSKRNGRDEDLADDIGDLLDSTGEVSAFKKPSAPPKKVTVSSDEDEDFPLVAKPTQSDAKRSSEEMFDSLFGGAKPSSAPRKAPSPSKSGSDTDDDMPAPLSKRIEKPKSPVTLDSDSEDSDFSAPAKKPTNKAAKKKHDSDSDDFFPSKATSSKKAASSKGTAKPRPKKTKKGSDDDDASDFEAELEKKKKKSVAKPKKPTQKRAPKGGSDSDESPKKKKPKAKAASSGSDSDIASIPLAERLAPPPRRAAQKATQVKYAFSSSEESD